MGMILLICAVKMNYEKERTYERCLMKWFPIKLCSMLNTNQKCLRKFLMLNM